LPAQPPSLTHTLVMAAFVALFLLVLVYALWIGLLCLAGRVLVRLEGGRGMVRTGVGPIRWTQRFDASAVRYVRMIDANGNTEATHGLDQLNDHFGRISIETDRKNVSLAKIMNKAERRWLLGVLRALLEPPR